MTDYSTDYDKHLIEKSIVNGLSESIKYLYRDEGDQLWVSKGSPKIEDDLAGEKYVVLPLTYDINDTHSLSAFNHLFDQVKPFDILELKRETITKLIHEEEK